MLKLQKFRAKNLEKLTKTKKECSNLAQKLKS